MHNTNWSWPGAIGPVCIGVVALALLAVPASPPAKAADPVTIVLADMALKDVLGELDKAVSERIKQAQAAGDALLVKMGEELRQVIRNLGLMLDDQRDKLFKDVSKERQAVFLELHGLINRLDKVAEKDFRDTLERLPLDMKHIALRGLGGEVDFFVQRIDGLTQYRHAGKEYKLLVRGLGLGYDDSEASYKPEVLIEDKALPAGQLRKLSARDLDVRVPADFLDSRFKKDEMTYVKGTVRSTITKAKPAGLDLGIIGKLFQGSGKESKTYGTDFTLLLLPTEPGEVEVEEIIEARRLGAVQTHTLEASVSEAIKGCKPPWTIQQTWTAPDGAEIAGVRYECYPGKQVTYKETHSVKLGRDGGFAVRTEEKTGYESAGEILKKNAGGIAGWTYAVRKDGYDPDYEVNGLTVTVYRKATLGGAHTTTVKHHIDYRPQEAVNETVRRKVKLSWDEPLVLDLDPRNKTGAYTIRGELATREKILVTAGTAANSSSPLKAKGSHRHGDHDQIVFELARP
jgi:hypothetical protein